LFCLFLLLWKIQLGMGHGLSRETNQDHDPHDQQNFFPFCTMLIDSAHKEHPLRRMTNKDVVPVKTGI
jgi:hypothetical protein